MAVTEIPEYHPHAGAVWARAIDLLSEATLDEDKTFGFSIALEAGFRQLRIGVTLAGDVSLYKLNDLGTPDTEKYNVEYVATLTGIRKMPPVFPKFAGARNTLDFWIGYAGNMRKAWLEECVGWTSTIIDGLDYTVTPPATRLVGDIWRCTKGLHFAVDWIMAAANSGTAPVAYEGSQPEFQGQPALAPVLVIGSGGGSVDLTPVVTAINDNTRRDVQTTIDNGAITVLQYSGDIMEP